MSAQPSRFTFCVLRIARFGLALLLLFGPVLPTSHVGAQEPTPEPNRPGLIAAPQFNYSGAPLNYGSPVSMGDPISTDNGAHYFSLPPLSLDVALAQGECPSEARVSVDQPLCPNSPAVTGRVTGTACSDAALTIRHTACTGIDDLLVGVGRTEADGTFSVPLSRTLEFGSYSCHSWIDVNVECFCGPVRATSAVAGLPRFHVPWYIPQPQAGQITLSGQGDMLCAGATLTVADQQGHTIGTSIVREDGSFVTQLLRPLETNEILFVTTAGGVCGFCSRPDYFLYIGPVAVPEPSTLLLFAGGLAGLAAMAKARQRRRFARR